MIIANPTKERYMNREEALRKALSSIDESYIIRIRREIHQCPELGFDLDNTVSIVKRELDAIGIEYTDKLGKSSVVATMNREKSSFTIGIRADMDALPIQENTGLPFSSRNPGKMHACGHDAHTAILLGTAKALKSVEKEIDCRIKLIFQSYEEGTRGAELLVKDGVMNDIDVIIALHVTNSIPSGTLGIGSGTIMAADNQLDFLFTGKSSHAVFPQNACDPIAMAVSAYNQIQLIRTRKTDPTKPFVLAISRIQSGSTYNVIPSTAAMKGTIRSFDLAVNDFVQNQVGLICQETARLFGGTCRFDHRLGTLPLTNDPKVTDAVKKAIAKAVGKKNLVKIPIGMGSEDFSYYSSVKPAAFFRLGTYDEKSGPMTSSHQAGFIIDEKAFKYGSMTFINFIFDNMDGLE